MSSLSTFLASSPASHTLFHHAPAPLVFCPSSSSLENRVRQNSRQKGFTSVYHSGKQEWEKHGSWNGEEGRATQDGEWLSWPWIYIKLDVSTEVLQRSRTNRSRRRFIIRCWLTLLWVIRNPRICHLSSGKKVVHFGGLKARELMA